jgi:shikimate dehydrogenase
MKLFGLFGFPLSHSFSKKYFTEKFQREGLADCSYENFESRNVEDLKKIVAEQKDLVGLNVTIPHKQNVVAMMDEFDAVAKEIGAVNCVKIKRKGEKFQLCGYNTDAYGFEQSIKPFLKENHKQALLLGLGGSSKAVAFAFRKLNIEYFTVTRENPLSDYTFPKLTKDILQSCLIVVNCTPLGMSPNVNSFPPISYQYISKQHILFDLVYNPAETQFLKKGKEQGAVTLNGMEMLRLQAEKSWEIWNSRYEKSDLVY